MTIILINAIMFVGWFYLESNRLITIPLAWIAYGYIWARINQVTVKKFFGG